MTSRVLLEIQIQELEVTHPTEQSYWLIDIKTACCANSITVVAAHLATIARGLTWQVLSPGTDVAVDPTPNPVIEDVHVIGQPQIIDGTVLCYPSVLSVWGLATFTMEVHHLVCLYI